MASLLNLYQKLNQKIVEEKKYIQAAAYEELKELLAEAAEIQQENMEILTQKKGEIKTKLLELYGRKKSIKGYHSRGHQEAKFFDQKS